MRRQRGFDLNILPSFATKASRLIAASPSKKTTNCKSFPAGALLSHYLDAFCAVLSRRPVNPGKTFSRNGSPAFDHLTGDYEFFDPFLGRQGIHGVKQE